MKRATYIVLSMLFLFATGNVFAQNPTCSNATLNGRYSFQGRGEHIELSLLNLITLQQHIETAGTVTLDGNGNVTASTVQVLVDGQNNTDADGGTYTLNADCTGTLTLNDPVEPLTYIIAAAGIDPSTGLAVSFAGEDSSVGIDLDINATLLSTTVGNASTASAAVHKAAAAAGTCGGSLMGVLSGGSGSETDSAEITLVLSGESAVFEIAQAKINGIVQTRAGSFGTVTYNADCSFKASVTNGSTTYTITGTAPVTTYTSVESLPGGLGGPIGSPYLAPRTTSSLTLSDGTRGLSGTGTYLIPKTL